MFQYFFVLICGLVLWSIARYIKWRTEVYDKVEKIGGPKAYPIIGTLYLFQGASRTDISRIVIELTRKYGPFYRTWKMFTPEVHLVKPEHLEQIMTSSVLLKKGSAYMFLSQWLGGGLLLTDGVKWHQQRKLITPTFHFKILDTFMDVFQEKSKMLIEHLEKKCNGNSFDIYPYINHCALDIICETAMGVTIDAMSDRNNSYIEAINNMNMLVIKRMHNPLHRTKLYPIFSDGKSFQSSLQISHNFTNNVITDRRKLLTVTSQRKLSIEDILMSQKKRLSFLDLLLDASNGLSDAEIRAEVDTFMFAGHDTTTTAVGWCLLLLANHQNIQDRVYQEIKSVLKNASTPESISHLNDLNYLECCIKETLRLYPSVPFIGRSLTEDTVIDGCEIPKGTDCILHIYDAHRNPDVFSDPNKFDPDRFSPENTLKRHPYAYIPFSAGPRNCIGQKFAIYEAKTIVASIIKAYKVLPGRPVDPSTLVFEIILRSIDGISIVLEKREG